MPDNRSDAGTEDWESWSKGTSFGPVRGHVLWMDGLPGLLAPTRTTPEGVGRYMTCHHAGGARFRAHRAALSEWKGIEVSRCEQSRARA